MNRPLQSCFEGTQRGISCIDLFGSKVAQIFEVAKYSSLGLLKNSKYMFQWRPWVFVTSFEIYVLVPSISSHVASAFATEWILMGRAGKQICLFFNSWTSIILFCWGLSISKVWMCDSSGILTTKSTLAALCFLHLWLHWIVFSLWLAYQKWLVLHESNSRTATTCQLCLYGSAVVNFIHNFSWYGRYQEVIFLFAFDFLRPVDGWFSELNLFRFECMRMISD